MVLCLRCNELLSAVAQSRSAHFRKCGQFKPNREFIEKKKAKFYAGIEATEVMQPLGTVSPPMFDTTGNVMDEWLATMPRTTRVLHKWQ